MILITEPVSIALSHILLIFQFLLHQHFHLQGCWQYFEVLYILCLISTGYTESDSPSRPPSGFI